MFCFLIQFTYIYIFSPNYVSFFNIPHLEVYGSISLLSTPISLLCEYTFHLNTSLLHCSEKATKAIVFVKSCALLSVNLCFREAEHCIEIKQDYVYSLLYSVQLTSWHKSGQRCLIKRCLMVYLPKTVNTIGTIFALGKYGMNFKSFTSFKVEVYSAFRFKFISISLINSVVGYVCWVTVLFPKA